MVTLKPIVINNITFLGITVEFPKTTLLAISTEKGYVMCGALDIALLNERLRHRKIIAGRAVGVKTLEELLEASLESVTLEAKSIGIHPGMDVIEALIKMV